MTTTPEGKIKTEIKKILDAYGVYYFMPVQMGIGAAGLDFHCVVNCGTAFAFFVEAKAPGKMPTARQWELIHKLRDVYKAQTFVIDDDAGLDQLRRYLDGFEVINERIRKTASR